MKGEDESCVYTYFLGMLAGLISLHQGYKQMTLNPQLTSQFCEKDLELTHLGFPKKILSLEGGSKDIYA